MPTGPRFNAHLAGLTAGGLAYMLYSSAREEQPPEITMQEFLRECLVKGYVDRLQIVNQSICRVFLRNETPNVPVTSHGKKVLLIQLGSLESFEANIEQVQVQLGLEPLDF